MSDAPLLEAFASPALHPRLRWHCEPTDWRISAATKRLRIRPAAGTDFWQRPQSGSAADNGHFLYAEASGDFVLMTKVTSHPAHRYDQAGLMVRVSAACWLKTSIEFEPERPNRLGAVVTNAHYSDWSMQPIDAAVHTVWLRVRAEASDYIVESSLAGESWEQIRTAHLQERSARESVACGLYACSPTAAGYEAQFAFLRLMPGRST